MSVLTIFFFLAKKKREKTQNSHNKLALEAIYFDPDVVNNY